MAARLINFVYRSLLSATVWDEETITMKLNNVSLAPFQTVRVFFWLLSNTFNLKKFIGVLFLIYVNQEHLQLLPIRVSFYSNSEMEDS